MRVINVAVMVAALAFGAGTALAADPIVIAAYARTPEPPEEYRHRMAVNAAALLFVTALIGVAIWLADSISDMRRNQDCVLSGRRGCTPVEFDRNVR